MSRMRTGRLLVSACALACGLAAASLSGVAGSATSSDGHEGGTATAAAIATPADDSLPVMPPQEQFPGTRPPLTKKERAAAQKTQHIVVIYMQNNSFDKLYGRWGSVGGEQVDGVANAAPRTWRQVNQEGDRIRCALINDVNLAPGRLAGPSTCGDRTGVASNLYPRFGSAFRMKPFLLNEALPASAVTCPFPGNFPPNGTPVNSSPAMAGGCTQDIVHQFYQEQYQHNGGKQNRYATGSNAAGLVMGQYDTKSLRVYEYLMGKGAPRFAVADRFFAGVFGGSFINGVWVSSATVPIWPDAPASLYSVLDRNGMPVTQTPKSSSSLGQYNLYKSPDPNGLVNGVLTQACGPSARAGHLCGDYVVNTPFSVQWPYPATSSPATRMPLLTYDTLGDRLNEAGIDWAWYSGGWTNAVGRVGDPGWTNGSGPVTRSYTASDGSLVVNDQGCPDPTSSAMTTWPQCPDGSFQYHHQTYNYFYNWSTATEETRENREDQLLDTEEWWPLTQGSTCRLKPVSYVQSLGKLNQHPGYSSAYIGDEQVAMALRSIYEGPCAQDTLTIVTYDEFGGAWDHVPPPGLGKATPGAHDEFGPGTRVPSLIVSNLLPRTGVDSTTYDLASVVGTILAKYGLAPVNSRDTEQATLWTAWSELAAAP